MFIHVYHMYTSYIQHIYEVVCWYLNDVSFCAMVRERTIRHVARPVTYVAIKAASAGKAHLHRPATNFQSRSKQTASSKTLNREFNLPKLLKRGMSALKYP